MSHEDSICRWIRQDDWRMAALEEARSLALPDWWLPDWWLAAGFVRNLVWDRWHGVVRATPLNDIDLIYCDPAHTSEARDRALSRRLQQLSERCGPARPWSVKNQARMHLRHGRDPYANCRAAMSDWVECETAVGVRLEPDGTLTLAAPLGLDSLMAGRITLNPRHGNAETLKRRALEKRWLQRWPRLVIVAAESSDTLRDQSDR